MANNSNTTNAFDLPTVAHMSPIVADAPHALFAEGEQGAWLDPSLMGSMYQDAEGTKLVTRADQPVGLILDRSGRGHHASQSIAARRPILDQRSDGRWLLAFDGVDDALITDAIDLSAKDEASVFLAANKGSDATGAIIVESSVNFGANPGAFRMSANSAPGNIALGLNGNPNMANSRLVTVAAGTPFILTGLFDTSANKSDARLNGVAAGTLFSSCNGGVLGNYPLYIGRRAGTGTACVMDLYGLIVRSGLAAGALLTDTEAYMAAAIAS